MPDEDRPFWRRAGERSNVVRICFYCATEFIPTQASFCRQGYGCPQQSREVGPLVARAAQKKGGSHLLLISAPWPLFNRPSIQLGSLKAFVRQELPDIDVFAGHFFLQLAEHLGYDIYNAVSQRTWLAESVYAAILFPEKSAAAERFFFREARKNELLRKLDFQDLVKRTAEFSDEFIAALPAGKMLLAGFSISFCQLTASLYLIKQLKARFPDLPITVGGASVAGKAGLDLQQAFPQIDFVVQGEGELPLVNLLKHLQAGTGCTAMPSIAGVIMANRDPNPIPCQMNRLDRLPPPDYDDYFESLNRFAAAQRFFPSIPVEASRGCWWQQRYSDKGQAGCAFCNLNMQWQGYRSKSAQDIATQIKYLVGRYRVLSLLFTDNVLPAHICRPLFTHLSELKMDLKLFAEIRAHTSLPILQQMKLAGMRELQIGIEALSTRLLRRMHKGTRAIDNIQAMKDCEAQGIVNASNLLIQFPGSTVAEVQETLRALDFVAPFRPLRPVRFWLGLQSPVWQQPKDFGLTAVSNHVNYRHLFPAVLFKQLTFTIQSYRGDIKHQRTLWRPVVRKVKQWRQDYAAMVRRGRSEPPLHYQDGRDFLIIVQRRPEEEPRMHRLTGHSRSIYLFCRRHRALKRILVRFSFLSENNIRSFLKMMVSKRLMFEEDDRYLSLAVPLRL